MIRLLVSQFKIFNSQLLVWFRRRLGRRRLIRAVIAIIRRVWAKVEQGERRAILEQRAENCQLVVDIFTTAEEDRALVGGRHHHAIVTIPADACGLELNLGWQSQGQRAAELQRYGIDRIIWLDLAIGSVLDH